MSLHIIPYKPLARCGIDELAAEQRARERRRMTGGVAFARKEFDDEKSAARTEIVKLMALDAMPNPIHVLSMPGLSWHFEGKLLKLRDANWRTQPCLTKTLFTCVENDRFIYYSATTKMPGNKQSTVRALPRPEYAERAMGNDIVNRFAFANVDELMQDTDESFDVAWLDYTGPMSVERLRLIEQFWRDRVRSLLVVTSLKARWNKEAGRHIDRHGSVNAWLRARLPGNERHAMEYQDGASPMTQFAVSK